MINQQQHGEKRSRRVPVNNGGNSCLKHEKYCAKHGWIDLFPIGGELAWHSQHSKCDKQVEQGAYVVPVEPAAIPKVMKKAA